MNRLIGNAALIAMGEWTSASSYLKNSVVTDNGSSYVSKTDVPAGTALSNTTYWMNMASKGDTGSAGLHGLTVSMSNPAHTLPKTTAGVITYTNSGTTLRVYEGTTELVYDGVGTSNGTWKAVLTASNITAGTVTDGGNYMNVGNHSGMTANTASITFAVSGKRQAGTAFSLSVIQSLSIALQGDTGATGATGPAGPATIAVGTVTAGALAVTNSGTSQDAVLNFVIPTGGAADAINLTDSGDFYPVKQVEAALQQNGSQLAQMGTYLDETTHIVLPAWEIGYISGSTGAPGGGTPNSNLRTPLLMVKKGTIVTNTHTGILHIYRYTSAGIWIDRLTYISGAGWYIFTADTYVRLSLEYGTLTSDTSLGNTLVSIVSKSAFVSLNEIILDAESAQQSIIENTHGLAEVKSQIFDSSNVTLPLWEYGYISASSGAETLNYITARTTDIIPLPPGTTLEALDANATFAVMKYVNGAWNSQLESLTTADGVYRINVLTYVRINYSYAGNPTITDLTLPNTMLRITRPTFNTQAFSSNYWCGRKIVWFGTSIPEGPALINGAYHTYPSLIGQMLGATVYNEAVGSSCVRAGSHADITVSDPMGYAGMIWNVLLKSFSLSSTEKQDIFDNWETWQPLLKGTAPASISAEDQTMYKNCSWDIKLVKYLSGGSIGAVDLYVFDHGHNDSIDYNYSDASEMGVIPSSANNRTYFIGAMNFLINKILENNPKARILFIGHYENARKAGISLSQEILADIWDFPLIKTWEKMGWSQKSITSGGTTKTVTQWWMPDDIHPHSDTTGAAIIKYAETLYPHVRDVR